MAGFQAFLVKMLGLCWRCLIRCQAMQLVHHCQQESTELRLGWKAPMYPHFSCRNSYAAQHHQAASYATKRGEMEKTMGEERWY